MIHHVTREIPPAALEACIDFYAVLGFKSVRVPDGIAGRAVWLERGMTQLHLMPSAGATPVDGHVGLVVESYEERLAQLRDAGHEVDCRHRHWGSPRAYVRDPAGNLVELMAWPPGEFDPGAAPPD